MTSCTHQATNSVMCIYIYAYYSTFSLYQTSLFMPGLVTLFHTLAACGKWWLPDNARSTAQYPTQRFLSSMAIF